MRDNTYINNFSNHFSFSTINNKSMTPLTVPLLFSLLTTTINCLKPISLEVRAPLLPLTDKFLKESGDLIYATSSVSPTILPGNNNNIWLIRNYAALILKGNITRRQYNYLISDTNLTNTIKTIQQLGGETNLLYRSKYLILINDKINEAQLIELYEFLWLKYQIYNVVVLNQGCSSTWYPFKDCLKPPNTNNIISIGNNTEKINLFTNKIPKTLNNCLINVTWSRTSLAVKNAFNQTDPGSFILFFNEIAKRAQLKVNYLRDNLDLTQLMLKGVIFDNVTKILNEQNVNLAIGGLMETSGATKSLDYSTYIRVMETFIALPPRKILPKWKEFLIFQPQTIIVLTIIILIVGFGFYWLLRENDYKLISSIFMSVQLFLQMTLVWKPNQTHTRLFLIFMLLFAMEINIAYLSALSGVFTEPNYEKKIKNIEQFAESGIPFKSFPGILNSFRVYGETVYKKIQTNFIAENKMRTFELIQEFLQNPDHSFIMSMEHLNYLKNYQILERCGKVMPSTFYVFALPKRSILTEKFNFHIRDMDEKGLVQKFEELSAIYVPKFLLHEDDPVTVLKVDDLIGVFTLWVIGITLAIIIFFTELIIGQYLRRRDKRKNEMN